MQVYCSSREKCLYSDNGIKMCNSSEGPQPQVSEYYSRQANSYFIKR